MYKLRVQNILNFLSVLLALVHPDNAAGNMQKVQMISMAQRARHMETGINQTCQVSNRDKKLAQNELKSQLLLLFGMDCVV